METVTVDVHRVGNAPGHASVEHELEADLARARWLARLLDSQFVFMGVEFGLDALVGLVPVVGDCVTALAAMYPVHIARKHKLGKRLEARMALNVLMDFLGGAVPVVGDLIDVVYKANLKNLKLLEKAVERRRQRPSA
jgi:hypothetical protein